MSLMSEKNRHRFAAVIRLKTGIRPKTKITNIDITDKPLTPLRNVKGYLRSTPNRLTLSGECAITIR